MGNEFMFGGAGGVAGAASPTIVGAGVGVGAAPPEGSYTGRLCACTASAGPRERAAALPPKKNSVTVASSAPASRMLTVFMLVLLFLRQRTSPPPTGGVDS